MAEMTSDNAACRHTASFNIEKALYDQMVMQMSPNQRLNQKTTPNHKATPTKSHTKKLEQVKKFKTKNERNFFKMPDV